MIMTQLAVIETNDDDFNCWRFIRAFLLLPFRCRFFRRFSLKFYNDGIFSSHAPKRKMCEKVTAKILLLKRLTNTCKRVERFPGGQKFSTAFNLHSQSWVRDFRGFFRNTNKVTNFRRKENYFHLILLLHAAIKWEFSRHCRLCNHFWRKNFTSRKCFIAMGAEVFLRTINLLDTWPRSIISYLRVLKAIDT